MAKKNSSNELSFVFFGSPDFAVDILDKLKQHKLLPKLVVTAPDKPRGRGQETQTPPAGKWAKKHDIPILQPKEITDAFIKKLKELAPDNGWDLFVVVAYGHILPKILISLPTYHTLNVHPSLLPRLRGPAPIRGAILEENETGISLIKLDEKMDHGPVVAQKKVIMDQWPPRYPDLRSKLADTGGKLLAQTIPQWVSGNMTATPQEDDKATYTKKFSSSDGKIDLNDNPEKNLRKIRAFTDWPKAYFFVNDERVLITSAHIENGELIIDTVKPAGQEEVSYDKFINR